MTSAGSLKPLAAGPHGGYFWQRARGYQHAATRALAPITRRELPRAVGAFPLAFVYTDEWPVLHAVLGAEPKRSAFVDGRGRWRGPYVPAYLRAHPFYLAENGRDRHVVAVDESAEELAGDAYTGEALFDETDAPTPALARVIDFLGALARSRVQTDRAAQALEEAGVLAEWRLALDLGGEKPQRLSGLYRVDESRLNALDAASLQRLRDTGALGLAYGQLLSAEQRRRLEALARTRAREQKLPEADAVFGEPDLERQIDWDRLDFGDEES
ncbi:SapC family protein [Halorhodospira halochloris]|uniref:SapC family protein n=1 Tax=Halorhodospira halochloris TaxID=1052 RepID=UPI001EE841D0|nr:SapC family protein [Halorhodospira halochloris]MCG5531446.1 SapC family protein [Halorhodospira halochloris]